VPIARRALADNEEVLVDVRLHWAFFAGPAALTAVAVAVAVSVAVSFPKAPVGVAWVLAAMIAVPAVWLAGRLVRWFGISLVVTTARLIYRQGVFGRDMVQLRLQRVAEIQCTQTLADRLVGSGRLVVELVGGDEPIVIDDVRRPRALQRVITRQLDALMDRGVQTVPSAAHGVPMYPASPQSATSADDTPPHGFIPSTSPAPTAPPGAPDGSPSTTGAAAGSSIPEQLIQLDDLRRRGIITDDEFNEKKAVLLSRL
jgi:membrane protein YdbS with pleckstrin-like domain